MSGDRNLLVPMWSHHVGPSLTILAQGAVDRLVVFSGESALSAVQRWSATASGFGVVLRADVDRYRDDLDAGAADLGELVGDLIEQVCPEAVLPEEFGDRVDLFKELTSDVRALVVLVNASEPAQVAATYVGGKAGMNVVVARSFLRELKPDGARFFEVLP